MSSYLKKYRIEYTVENTTGNMYSIDVNIDRSNWKVSLKPTPYRTNAFDPTEKLDWRCITNVLMRDPIIRGICDSINDDTDNPKRIDIISFKGKKFRTRRWFVNADNNVISIAFGKVTMIKRENSEINLITMPDEFTTQSLNSFGLEVNVKMVSTLTDFVYLLKRTKLVGYLGWE